MATRTRRTHLADQPTDWQRDWLNGERVGSWHFAMSGTTEADVWATFGAQIVAEHVRDYPGTRPARWWDIDAPEPRRRLGGIGTALEALALDRVDPPRFESEAGYLKRHGLLTVGERKRLTAAAFEPESVLDILGLEASEA